MRDYSTKGEAETIEMMVRPGMRYGKALGGERVLVDRAELLRSPTLDTLQFPEDAAAKATAEAKAKEAEAPKPPPMVEAIKAQFERVKEQRREVRRKAAEKEAKG